MKIAEREHVFEAIFAPFLMTASGAEFLRVGEGPEEHVPDGKIGEVIGMMSELMMDAVRFRALENVTKPARRADVPVVENFTQRDADGVVAGRLKIGAEESEDKDAADDGV